MAAGRKNYFNPTNASLAASELVDDQIRRLCTSACGRLRVSECLRPSGRHESLRFGKDHAILFGDKIP